LIFTKVKVQEKYKQMAIKIYYTDKADRHAKAILMFSMLITLPLWLFFLAWLAGYAEHTFNIKLRGILGDLLAIALFFTFFIGHLALGIMYFVPWYTSRK
jgi:hypothetical protein